MALYIYRCEEHGEFDAQFPMSIVPRECPCPKCDKMAKKTIGKCNFQLKGKGWPGKEIKEENEKS